MVFPNTIPVMQFRKLGKTNESWRRTGWVGLENTYTLNIFSFTVDTTDGIENIPSGLCISPLGLHFHF